MYRMRCPPRLVRTHPDEAGVTLIDTVVGTALLLSVFVGVAGAFQLSIDVVTNNKARAGAIALSNERMEYLRSLTYASLGTSGGVPSGSLEQEESLAFNGVSYTRRTLILYADDPKDGVSPADANPADYKAARVGVSWLSRTGEREMALVSRFEPASGLESSVSGGTLSITVVSSESESVANAQVTVTNADASPQVQVTTYTNTSGTVTLLGTPAASDYSVSVTKSGYSTAQTYDSSEQNPNPSPANLTVTSGQTTTQTLSIDVLGTLTLITKKYSDGEAIGTVPVTIRGAKTIGTNPTVYKYSATKGGSGSATTTVSSLEWDSYTFEVDDATGYDLATVCAPQPYALAPGESAMLTLHLTPHTTHSLPVIVRADAGSALIGGASVRLYGNGYDETQATDECGQTFFSGLSEATYSMSVDASGYATFTSSSVPVGTTTAQYQVQL